MTWTGRGRVQNGAIVFPTPLELPEGMEVVVQVEPLTAAESAAPPAQAEELVRLPFFGMYADREDLQDSAAWVRGERERWQQRGAMRD
jgi:hypothetical protein